MGGGFAQGGVHASAEVFDPVGGRWHPLPSLRSGGRSGCRACALVGDGAAAALMVMGGYDADLKTVATVRA